MEVGIDWRCRTPIWAAQNDLHQCTDLAVFQPTKPIILRTSASGFVIAGILYQYNGFGILQPVNFYSRMCSPAHQNYDMYDSVVLAVVETLTQWKCYLECTNHKVLIQCDHNNLEYFPTCKVLSPGWARWMESVSSYDFVSKHLEGKKNTGSGPSRMADNEIGYKRLSARLLASFATTTVQLYNNLLEVIKTAQAMDTFATDVKNWIVGTATVDNPHLQSIDEQDEDSGNKWKVTTRVPTYEGRIVVPIDDLLPNTVISVVHENPDCTHFGALNTKV